jgi:hypothetical protein
VRGASSWLARGIDPSLFKNEDARAVKSFAIASSLHADKFAGPESGEFVVAARIVE